MPCRLCNRPVPFLTNFGWSAIYFCRACKCITAIDRQKAAAS